MVYSHRHKTQDNLDLKKTNKKRYRSLIMHAWLHFGAQYKTRIVRPLSGNEHLNYGDEFEE